MPMCGGLSDVKDADKDVQQICDKVSKILFVTIISRDRNATWLTSVNCFLLR